MSTQIVNRQYSQNRLCRRLLRRLLARSSIDKGDLVYDIGAGDGVITVELAKRGARVIAIEKEKKLFLKLDRKSNCYPHVALRNTDFLAEALPQYAPYKVFANIPFACTAPIFRKLFFAANPPVDSYLVVQREAAERFAGINKECLLSLLLKSQFRFSILYTFKPEDFFPVPGIDIVLLRIEKRRKTLVTLQHLEQYHRFITHGLCCGRPTIKSALKDQYSYAQFTRLSRDLEFSLNSAPSDLTFPQWLGLFNFLLEKQSTGNSGKLPGKLLKESWSTGDNSVF